MEYNMGMSTNSNAKACVQEATAKLRNPKLILFFSAVPNFEEYTRLIYEKFPNSICMGATTIAAFSKEGADKNTLKVVGFESGITCSADVLEDIDKYPIRYVGRVKRCLDEVRDTRNTICLEFTTALLCAEESVLTALNSVLLERKVPVFGGTAGDTGTATGTKVSLNGKVREKSTVFAIIHNEGGAIKIFRENIYTPITGKILTATKADASTRTVHQYNQKPAIKVFAEELGVAESQVGNYLDTNPMGRIIGDEMYITANCMVQNQAMVYHARIYDNSSVVALKPGNYREIIEETKQEIRRSVPRPSFSIMCHCLARTILFEGEGYLKEYSRTMSEVLGSNYIGFSGYGEQYGEQHFNQTMTVAVFE